MEGARSLGLNHRQAMCRVILPQASKIAMPSIINQLVIMIKDSSLLLAIGFGELLYQAQQLYAANFRVTETLLMRRRHVLRGHHHPDVAGQHRGQEGEPMNENDVIIDVRICTKATGRPRSSKAST